VRTKDRNHPEKRKSGGGGNPPARRGLAEEKLRWARKRREASEKTETPTLLEGGEGRRRRYKQKNQVGDTPERKRYVSTQKKYRLDSEKPTQDLKRNEKKKKKVEEEKGELLRNRQKKCKCRLNYEVKRE